MTDAQIFQVFGLAYAAMGLGGLFAKESFKRIVEGYTDSPALLHLSGLLALILGFLLVTFHNVWIVGWTLIITIGGWLALINGMMILAFPGFYSRVSGSMKKSPKLMRVYAGFVLLLGVLMLLLGFGVL
jgi:hypothetical protein